MANILSIWIKTNNVLLPGFKTVVGAMEEGESH